MKNRTKTSIMLAAILGSTTLQADTFGGEVSLGFYTHTPSGSASYDLPDISNAGTADLEGTLGWEENTDYMFKVYFEHPVPLIPNIKFGYTNIGYEGSSTPSGFIWGNIDNYTGELFSNLELGVTDLTAYYEVLDSDISLDAGVTLRHLLGDISINPLDSKRAAEESLTFSTLTPMLYGKARFTLPDTDFSMQLEANAGTFNEVMLYDFELGIRYLFAFGLGLEGGYKYFHLDSDSLEEGLAMELDTGGYYAAIVWDF